MPPKANLKDRLDEARRLILARLAYVRSPQSVSDLAGATALPSWLARAALDALVRDGAVLRAESRRPYAAKRPGDPPGWVRTYKVTLYSLPEPEPGRTP